MDQTTITSLTSLLTDLGLGQRVAGVVSVVAGVVTVAAHLLPWLPVPDDASPTWVRLGYRAVSFLAGGYGKVVPQPLTSLLPSVPAPTVPVVPATQTVGEVLAAEATTK